MTSDMPRNLLPKVRIIHDTDPEKYFSSIIRLERQGAIRLSGLHRHSVLRSWVRGWRRERLGWKPRSARAWSDLRLRLRLPFIRDEVVLVGFAPWDWRILLLNVLVKRNRVIYHSSWPDWELGSTPRQYGPFSRLLRRRWIKFLRAASVQVVCVLEATTVELESRWGVSSIVVPHAVRDEFFPSSRTSRSGGPIKLIYVGALTRRKGVGGLLELMSMLPPDLFELTIIGDGPMREAVEGAVDAGNISYLGPIWDKRALASIMKEHDIFLALSRRDEQWEEVFGIAIVEACAAGLGVVASDHVGPRTTLASVGGASLVNDGDVNEAADLLRDLVDVQSLNEFKSRHSRVADRYREDAVAQAWLRVFDPAP